MKKNLFLFFFSLSSVIFSQTGTEGVSISSSPIAPHPSAILDVQSQNKGVLITRMFYADREAINDPAPGLLIYQLDNTPGFYYFDGVWKCLSCCSNSPAIDWRTLTASDIQHNCFSIVSSLPYGGEALKVSNVDNIITLKGWFTINCTTPTNGVGYPSVISSGYAQEPGSSITYNTNGLRINNDLVDQTMIQIIGFGNNGISSIQMGPNVASGSYIYIDISYPAQ